MNTPTDAATTAPAFAEAVRDALPDHAHTRFTTDRSPHWEADWSTPVGVWKLTTKQPVNGDRSAPGGTLTGPGGTLTFPKGTHANQVIELLRGLNALPALGDLGTERRPGLGDGKMTHAQAAAALRGYLPDHAYITEGVPAPSPTFLGVGAITVGPRTEWTVGPRTEWTGQDEKLPRWEARWTNPHGSYAVELNPRDPSTRGFRITSPWGKWHVPNPVSHHALVSVLRGLRGIDPAAKLAPVDPNLGLRAWSAPRRPDGLWGRPEQQHVHSAVDGPAPRSPAEVLIRHLRQAMAPNTVDKGRRRDDGRWIDADVAAAVCAAHILAKEARRNG